MEEYTPAMKPPQPPSYQIRRILRALRMRIVIKANHVELVAPVASSDAEIRNFFHRHQNWVRQKTQRPDARSDVIRMRMPTSFGTGGKMPFQGREVSLIIHSSCEPRPQIVFDEGFLISLPHGLGQPEATLAARRMLLSWLKCRLLDEAQVIIRHHGTRLALYPRSVCIKKMNTRWGSLGIHNDMTLNLRLIFAPPSVLEYVVVHELCHIRHRNHSRRFWSSVAQLLPQYAAERAWLRAHGTDLMALFEEQPAG
jgi:predicted metal-dependent hydrolase